MSKRKRKRRSGGRGSNSEPHADGVTVFPKKPVGAERLSRTQGDVSPKVTQGRSRFRDRLAEALLNKVAALVVGGGLALLFAIYAVSSGVRNADDLVRQHQARIAAPASGLKYTVMIADLEGADGAAKADEISEALSASSGISVFRYPQVMRVSPVGDRAPAMAAAESLGRGWLATKNADLLIWGHSTGTQLHLRFLPRSSPGSKVQSFSQFDEVELSTEFKQALGDQLVAIILTAVEPLTAQQGLKNADLLRPSAARIDSLLRGNTPLTPVQRFTAFHSLALASLAIGMQGGDRPAAEAAIVAFDSALALVRPEKEPLKWAIAQNNLASALVYTGSQQSSTGRLKRAVTCLQDAAAVHARNADSIRWSLTLINLAGGLQTWGAHEEGEVLLDSALATARLALSVAPRERAPLVWVKALAAVGSNLTALGGRTWNNDLLDQAALVHRQVLQHLTRESYPLEWARAQSKLGLSLASHHHRPTTEIVALVNAAVVAYQSALTVYTPDFEPLAWGETQWMLGNAYRTLGELQNDVPRLQQAVRTIESSLTVYSQQETPHTWASIQYDLSGALLLLADRDISDTAALGRALTVANQAASVFTRERNPMQWAGLQYAIGRQRLMVGERTHNVQILREAAAAHRRALRVVESRAPQAGWHQWKEELKEIEQMIARDQLN